MVVNMFAREPVRPVRAAGAPRPASDLVDFLRRQLGIEPDEQQKAMLRAAGKQVLLNCGRQWGKSTMAAAMAVHRAHTERNSLVIVASPTDRQSGELLRKASEMVARLSITPRGDGTNKASLLFPNGSRIVALPGTERTVRGFSKVSLLMIDEAARVEDRLYRALTPMLSVGDGDLWLMSTPWGKRGFFYDEWTNGEDWMKVQVRATECPRIPARCLDKQRKRLGPIWFEQEYMCGFMDNGVGLFERRVVEEAMDARVSPMEFPSRWRKG